MRHEGPPVPSLPHIEMTIACLREHGVEVDDRRARPWTVCARSPIRAADVDRRARPVQRRAVPDAGADQRRPGARARAGRAQHHPGRRRPARPARRGWVPRSTLDDDGLTVAGAGADPRASTSTCTTSASSRPADRRPVRAGRRRPRGCAASRTSAATRPTGSPRSPPSCAASGPTSTEHDDGLSFEPAPLHGGAFHTYADHRMAHAAVVVGSRGRRACWSRTSPPPRRRSPASPTSGRGCCADDQRSLRRARPRELRAAAPAHPPPHQGPAHPTTTPCRAVVVTVDRGRYTCRLGESEPIVTAMKSRPLGRKARGHRRPGPAGRRHLRRRRLAGPDRHRRRARDRAAAYGRRRRPRRARDRGQRRPARHRHRARRPGATAGAGRPRPRGGVRRGDGPAALPDQGRPRRPRAAAARATARSGCRTS